MFFSFFTTYCHSLQSVSRILVFLLIFVGRSEAQQVNSPQHFDSLVKNTGIQKINCGIDTWLKEARTSPEFVAREKKMNEDITKTLGGNDTLTLPLVFHIISPNPNGVTNQRIAEAVKDLNDAFSKSGAYASSTGVDAKIRFALARKDPDGGVTTGINRITSLLGVNMFKELEDSKLKNLMQWNPVKYINIWVVEGMVGEIEAYFRCEKGWTRMQVGGYATFPGTTAAADGIVIAGLPGIVLAHEMGHYLSLYHTFDGCCTNNDCTLDGDRVCDTPPDCSRFTSASCSNPDNTCNTDTLSNYSNGFFKKDTTDFIANFMDYNNTACSNQFTQGQANRMRAAIQSQRAGLLNDVLVPPCGENISINFTRDNYYPKTGETVNFTAGAGFSNYEWLVNGNPAGTGASFTYTFPNTAKYKIALKAYNTAANCFAAYHEFVQPNCGITARFFSNKSYIASKENVLLDTIMFTNNTIGNATSFQWVINKNNVNRQVVTSNVAGAGPNDLRYAFPDFGFYSVKLIASNGTCTDSTSLAYVNVADPTQDAYVILNGATCYEQTKLMFYLNIYNNGFATLKKNLPVSFYNADPRISGNNAKKIGATFLVPDSISGYCGRNYQIIIDNAYPETKTIFAVANDDGNQTFPITIPYPGSPIVEKEYKNYNVYSLTDFRYTATIAPITTQLPGDIIRLNASTKPTYTFTTDYFWSPPSNLSCTNCSTSFFSSGVTSGSEIKQLITKSQWGCFDTTQVIIKVEATDYKIAIQNINCLGKDSVDITVGVTNLFTPGIIPKDLPIAFYRNNPGVAGATLIAGGLTVPVTSTGNQQVYTFTIKKPLEGDIYATINEKAIAFPLKFPAAQIREMSYTNNISPPYIYQLPSRTESFTICTGDTVYGRTVSGTYRDTILLPSGCDSLRILQLTVRPEKITRITITQSICAGAKVAGYTQTGVYTDRFTGTNACDSIRTLVLNVQPNLIDTIRTAICEGEQYRAAGKWQTTSGIYRDTFRTIFGCDSILITYLTVHPLPRKFLPNDTALCSGKSLVLNLPDFNTVAWSSGSNAPLITIKQSGLYWANVIDKNGCAGSDTIRIQFQYLVKDLFINAPCTGDTVLGRTIAGVYSDTFTTAAGCDSIRILHLSYKASSVATSLTVNICEGQQYAGYRVSGTYVDVYKGTNACDSIRTLQLIVNPNYRQTREVKICDGNRYQAGGAWQTRSGIYYDTLKSSKGCDSVIITQLSVTPLPVNFLPRDTILCLGKNLQISLPQFKSTIWNNGSVDYNLLISDPGKYWVNVVDANNCKGSDTLLVGYQRCIPIQIPNAFTPNGDYRNDLFRPVIPVVLKNYRMQIWNRMGYLVFDTSDYQKGWTGKTNGELQPAAVYVYMIRFTDEDGKEVVKNGTLLLIR